MRWLDSELPRLDRREVRAIRTEKADGEVIELARDDSDRLEFRMEGAVTVSGQDLARGLALPPFLPEPGSCARQPCPSSSRPSSTSRSRTWRRRDDVDLAGGTLAEYTTFDGLVVGVRVKRVAGGYWARFHARFDPDDAARGRGGADDPDRTAREARRESEAINARFGGWAYRIPDHKGEDLAMRRDALLVDVPAAEGRGG